MEITIGFTKYCREIGLWWRREKLITISGSTGKIILVFYWTMRNLGLKEFVF